MRLGGFVIHANAAPTLAECVDSLLAVCDEVVAIDSGSTDGSSELVRQRGVRSVAHPWQGYGAARAQGAAALPTADYLFFLDSDERLGRHGIEALRRWKANGQSHPYFKLRIRDWAELGGRRFVFRCEHHVRLIRRDLARWEPRMVVHEAMPRAHARRVDATIEHRFATSIGGRSEKEERYALLWALRAHLEGRRRKFSAAQRLAHTLRNAIVKGAFFRGGAQGLRLAWAVSRYHARKYHYLRELEQGRYREELSALHAGQFSELFALIDGRRR